MAERRHWLGSARARILAAYIAVLAFSAVFALVGVQKLLTSRTNDHVRATLDAHADRFAHFLRDRRPAPRDVDSLRSAFDAYLDRVHLQDEETFVAFVSGRHHRTVSAIDLPGAQVKRLSSLPVPPDGASGEFGTQSGKVHYLVRPVHAAGRRIGRLAVTLRVDDGWIDGELGLATGLVSAWLLLGSILAFIVSGRVLTPLSELADTARAINRSDLTRRIPVRGRDEVSELARTFNAMLDRLEATFAAQRNFTHDAGHDLRTPITIIRGNLELISDDPEERRKTVALVTDELDRMSRLVDDLLLIARAGQPDSMRMEPLDLQDFAHELLAKATALAPRRWRLVDATPGLVVADRQRLTDAVMNLADNAVRWSRDDEPIELGIALRHGDAHFWVRDFGPGIAPTEQERIFERFARGRDRAGRLREGTGLGLAIVRAVAEGHGGRAGVKSRPGYGSTFEMVIPADGERERARS